MKAVVKILLSGIIVWYAIEEYYQNRLGLFEVSRDLDIRFTILTILIFLVAVALYCKSLQTCLSLLAPHNRRSNPQAVWWMFAIPLNFIEDFFIVINVSDSLKEEARTNKSLASIRDFGHLDGIGWCIAQVLSFLPNTAGQIAGIAGALLWLKHWHFITQVNRLLIQACPSTSR